MYEEPLCNCISPSLTRCYPACTGEPARGPDGIDAGSVYPRVYRGTASTPAISAYVHGLSPRIRGNRCMPISIPICGGSVYGGTVAIVVRYGSERGLGEPHVPVSVATSLQVYPRVYGEPPLDIPPCLTAKVYPRVYGGTGIGGRYMKKGKGLSPRVGNLGLLCGLYDCRGSIPACTGEPEPHPRRASPRPGSIPACTGEPIGAKWIGACTWVYPRVYGGTPRRDPGIRPAPGLSPRVRGNPPVRTPRRYSSGSIPACTGEPNTCAP